MARAKTETKRQADQETIDSCIASAIADGDVVNFRTLFLSYSPLRSYSSEDIHTSKYAYLRPESDSSSAFKQALALVKRSDISAHIRAQLERKGPPQLPAEPLMMLADNAVRLGKYGAAAQAYELLRVRRRMREEYLRQADEALAAGHVSRAVYGYRTAAGLNYDYAAFPEALPQVPDYQSKALMLHAEYPHNPTDGIALRPPEEQVRTGLSYLLNDAEISGRLEAIDFELASAFLVELIHQSDSEWDAFVARFKEACALVQEHGARLERQKTNGALNLAEEAADQLVTADPREISAKLLGREIPGGEWWQYLKELAYQHPAAALFVSRQAVSKDLEIIMPRFLQGSPIAERLGLDAILR